jgi:hypothetical protein
MPCVAVAHTSSLVTVQDFGNRIGCTVATCLTRGHGDTQGGSTDLEPALGMQWRWDST